MLEFEAKADIQLQHEIESFKKHLQKAKNKNRRRHKKKRIFTEHIYRVRLNKKTKNVVIRKKSIYTLQKFTTTNKHKKTKIR